MCWVYNTRFPFPQADDDQAAVKSASRREHTLKMWARGPRRHSRQQGLLPESNGPLSGCPRGRPSLGRWRVNVQPKHDAHTRTHAKIKKKKTITNPKPWNKTPPRAPSKLKLLVQGSGLTVANNTMRADSAAGEETSSQSLFSSCPVLSKNGLKNKFYPKEKRIQFSKTISKRFSKAKKETKHLWLQGLVARRAEIYI